jgi:UDP-3-O-acyl-N-acetylglucosamine deacetylase
MAQVLQTTLAKAVSYEGIGLHAANKVHMIMRPPRQIQALCLSGQIYLENRLYRLCCHM